MYVCVVECFSVMLCVCMGERESPLVTKLLC